MGRADRLALATTQAVLHRIADGADVARLQNQRLAAEQAERGGVRVTQIATGQQLALVEPALGVNLVLVALERRDLVVGEELQLGEADAMLARNHPIKRACKPHDARDGGVGLLQHLVVVAIDRNVGVHIAVTSVHVQRHPDPATQDLLMNGPQPLDDRLQRLAGKDVFQWRLDLGAPAHPNLVRLQLAEQRQRPRLIGERRILDERLSIADGGRPNAVQQRSPFGAD